MRAASLLGFGWVQQGCCLRGLRLSSRCCLAVQRHVLAVPAAVAAAAHGQVLWQQLLVALLALMHQRLHAPQRLM